jgi:hypothetical protein
MIHATIPEKNLQGNGEAVRLLAGNLQKPINPYRVPRHDEKPLRYIWTIVEVEILEHCLIGQSSSAAQNFPSKRHNAAPRNTKTDVKMRFADSVGRTKFTICDY